MQTESIQSRDSEESYNPINDLQQRVEEIESTQYVTEEQIHILLEIIKILSEIPSGKQILNRALNLHQLEKLQQQILPRRKEDLNEILAMKMPEGIRDDMSTQQLRLIQQTLRHISHRRHFELSSAQTVRSVMEKFFRKVNHNKVLSHKGGPDAPDR